ncbi:response regulator [Anaeromyxobacter oryzae]|uniref:Response regulator n=1 Tax=Anaeromyxobacter oryzae TaxID=2918170 RepID=A0ABM7X0X3_9BACT|nr:response regulator [Anaeromyxobacter oryzae]
MVDDNEVLRALLAQALEHGGYDVITAECGAAALEVAAADPPDLCLVDHVMPGMSGAELIAALRTSPDPRLQAIPVIGFSGRDGAEEALLRAGAVMTLRKPLGEAPLLEAVRTVLPGGRSVERSLAAG